MTFQNSEKCVKAFNIVCYWAQNGLAFWFYSLVEVIPILLLQVHGYNCEVL